MYKDPGSFRDPAGNVLHLDGKIYRTVSNYGVENYEFVRKTGLLDELTEKNLLVKFHESSPDLLPTEVKKGVCYLLELDKIDFISYPYEWPFSLLKEAALTHLKVHLAALEKGVTLSDATAYNIQFVGVKSCFIDHLSFRKYVEGELWLGHQQFCNQFINPLLFSNKLSISYNNWYRATMEGISTIDIDNLLPWHRKLSLNILMHVTMQSYLQRKYHDKKPSIETSGKLPLSSFRNILLQLYNWIESLKPPVNETSAWRNYVNTTTYQSEEMAAKKNFISSYIKHSSPAMLWDIGCNTGEFSRVCLEAGVKTVIGFDSDTDVLDIAYQDAKKKELSFLPLYMDITNPSPSQGWRDIERSALIGRSSPDGLLALALIHHLVIGKNIPFTQVLDLLLDIAPAGVMEFVPKTDPMVKKLLAYKPDIYPDYTEELFMSYISARAKIVDEMTVTTEGRKLVFYNRE